MFCVCLQGHIDVVKALVADPVFGIKVPKTDHSGKTALELAIEQEHLEVIQVT